MVLGQDFFAVFFAALLVAGAFLAVDFVAVFFAGALLAAVEFVAFFAVDFAGVDFLAADFAGALLAADFVAVFFAGALLAAVEFAAFFALPDLDAERPDPEAAAKVSLGSFLAPETTAFRSAPALNFGIAVFLALIRSPVRGLRTQRASRTRFSNDPKPVIATFSPLATSRVMVSSTDSKACAAALRLPS